jgi:hypothetical protein
MTYREALETIIRMVREGAYPFAVATFIDEMDDHLTRSAVIQATRNLASVGTFAEVVIRDLEAFQAKRKREANRTAGNPQYPALPSVAKHRRLAKDRELTAQETKAYGSAVLEGIRALQRQELMRVTKNPPSATYETGADILERIAAENKRTFHRDCQSDRARRTDAQIIEAYEAAMAAKHAANAEVVKPAIVASKPAPVAKKPVDHSARMRQAWKTRRANAAKRAA